MTDNSHIKHNIYTVFLSLTGQGMDGMKLIEPPPVRTKLLKLYNGIGMY